MVNRIAVAIALVLVLVARSAPAQEYFDFGNIPGVPSEPNVEVDLNAALLGFVVEATKGGDAEVAAALAGLEGIRVRVYEELVDAAAVSGFIDSASEALERADWQRMIYVRDELEKVRIYVKMRDQQMTGMTVMVVDDSDAVFINVAGSITPAQLGRIARSMGAADALAGFGDSDDAESRDRDRRAADGAAADDDADDGR